MEPSSEEIFLSRVYQLLDELDGKKIDPHAWLGYDPRVYAAGIYNKRTIDEKTSELCERLKKVDVSQYSLEMQMWWRDHQLADKERQKAETNEKHLQAIKKRALAKLSEEERLALKLPNA